MPAVMSRADLQALIVRYFETWNRHDPAAVARCHAENGVVESPMYATLRGRKAIEEASRAFFSSFPDATFDVESTVIEPPRIVIFARVNATHMNDFFGLPGTNRHIEFRHVRLFEIDDQGLVAYERRIYDFTGVLVQVGVLRAKPAKP
jgi:steroid delta-isomerase-like uncharacterized protein